MKIKLASRKAALSLVGAIIIVGAIGVIVAIVIRCLVSMCHHLLPDKPPDGGGTNQVTHAQVQGLDEAGVLDLPVFVFPVIDVPSSALTSDHTIEGVMLNVQRSTNLVDWKTVLTTNDLTHAFIWSDDTNPPPDRAFYRTYLSFPNPRE